MRPLWSPAWFGARVLLSLPANFQTLSGGADPGGRLAGPGGRLCGRDLRACRRDRHAGHLAYPVGAGHPPAAG